MFRTPIISAFLVFFLGCNSNSNPSEVLNETIENEAIETIESEIIDPLFAPTILFTSNLLGYTEPCGCTQDLVLGGVDRIVAKINFFRQQMPETLVLDAGGMLFENIDTFNRDQEIRKTEVIIAAMQAMGTRATVPGRTDLANGLAFYLGTLADANIEVLAANLHTTDGVPVGIPDAQFDLADQQVHVIGVVSEDSFLGNQEVVVSPSVERINELSAGDESLTIVLFQGDIRAARRELAEIENVDFILIGQPRNTDEVEKIGTAFTLEAYDQGRFIGRLALFNAAFDGNFENTRSGSREEIAQLERIISGIQTQLAELPTFEGDPPPIVVRQQARMAELQTQLDAMTQEIESNAFHVSETTPSFYYEPIPMSIEIEGDPLILAEMMAFNQALREINANTVVTIPQTDPQAATYAGVQTCVTCHAEAVNHWQTSEHAHAYATLQERDKEFDRSCVSCHVTGFEQTSGSLINNLNGMENVQCEACHQQASRHIVAPMTTVNTEYGVRTNVPAAVCESCHNEIHSPNFDYETYLPRLFGSGHGGN